MPPAACITDMHETPALLPINIFEIIINIVPTPCRESECLSRFEV